MWVVWEAGRDLELRALGAATQMLCKGEQNRTEGQLQGLGSQQGQWLMHTEYLLCAGPYSKYWMVKEDRQSLVRLCTVTHYGRNPSPQDQTIDAWGQSHALDVCPLGVSLVFHFPSVKRGQSSLHSLVMCVSLCVTGGRRCLIFRTSNGVSLAVRRGSFVCFETGSQAAQVGLELIMCGR